MSEKKVKQKYTLFKKENDTDSASIRPCAFFNSSAGCRNGAACAFSHGQIPTSETRIAPVENNLQHSESKPPKLDKSKATTGSKQISQGSKNTQISSKPQHVMESESEDSDSSTDQESSFVHTQVSTKLYQNTVQQQPPNKVQQQPPNNRSSLPTSSEERNNQDNDSNRKRKSPKPKPSQTTEEPQTKTRRKSFEIKHPVGAAVRSSETHKNTQENDSDGGDEGEQEDTAFLFNAVNTALVGGRDSFSSGQIPQTQQFQHQYPPSQQFQQSQPQHQFSHPQSQFQQQPPFQQPPFQYSQQQYQQPPYYQPSFTSTPASFNMPAAPPGYANTQQFPITPFPAKNNSSSNGQSQDGKGFSQSSFPGAQELSKPPQTALSHNGYSTTPTTPGSNPLPYSNYQIPVSITPAVPPPHLCSPGGQSSAATVPAKIQHVPQDYPFVSAEVSKYRGSGMASVPGSVSSPPEPVSKSVSTKRKKSIQSAPVATPIQSSAPVAMPPQGIPTFISPSLAFAVPPMTSSMLAPPATMENAPSPQLRTGTRDAAMMNLEAWYRLMNITRSHPRFAKDYNYTPDSSWVAAKPYGDWAANLPAVVALDCEMCGSNDPVTGAYVPDALVRLSVISGINPSQVLIDTLVNPGGAVGDMRTRIHGIKISDMNGVQFTFSHAQAIILSICSDRTIVVGHGLCNDLKALRFHHMNVVDTAFLYKITGEGMKSASLRDVYKHISGTVLSDTHDSVEDARSSLEAAIYYHTSTFAITDSPMEVVRSTNEAKVVAENNSLLVHRISDSMTEENIIDMFVRNAFIYPVKVHPIIRSSSKSSTSGKATVEFHSVAHAELALETLPGPSRPDKDGRPQKRIYLKGGGYIYARKLKS